MLIGGSLLIHGAIFAAFNREPEPHASIGLISISAEIVLGAQANAGTSSTPSESDVTGKQSPKADNPTDIETEKARKGVAKQPVEEPKEEARQEKAETASPKAEEAPVAEKPPLTNEHAELTVQTKPAEKPKLTVEEKRPDAKDNKKIREAARHAKDDGREQTGSRCAVVAVKRPRQTVSAAGDPTAPTIMPGSFSRILHATSRRPQTLQAAHGELRPFRSV